MPEELRQVQGLMPTNNLWSVKCLGKPDPEPSFVKMIHDSGCGWTDVRTGDRAKVEQGVCPKCGGEIIADHPIPNIKY